MVLQSAKKWKPNVKQMRKTWLAEIKCKLNAKKIKEFKDKKMHIDGIIEVTNVDGYDVFNAFSPNNDNINDVFSFDDWMFKEINVEIFNRWGQQVFHWSGSGKYWDGKGYNGEKLPEGVYFYIMNAKAADGSSFREKGSVTLFR